MLSARADRIERRRYRSFAILDYKTGQPPTGKQVRMGLSPQLTLEALKDAMNSSSSRWRLARKR